MATNSTAKRTELAHRASDGVDVRLVWVHGGGKDAAVVSVIDSRGGTHFEIPTERHLALDVYYHPVAYRDLSTVDYEYRRAVA